MTDGHRNDYFRDFCYIKAQMILIKPWQEAQNEAYCVRDAVFIQEQGVPASLELDEFDPHALHALAYDGSNCIGTGRLVKSSPSEGRIGRMAVLKAYRGKGLGKQILESLIKHAKAQGLTRLTLHAQVPAISFYEQFGFKATGEPYDEAGIPHRDMMLAIFTSQ